VDSFDLADLSLEELMDIKVELVARRPQRLADVPAAAAVLTAEDIRRAGARTIPDALRLVPGVQVARVDANKWAISARGFNGLFSNKLLVLIDGRTVYSPLFSGVFWEAQDVVLEDIERIEVIRGPGGTLWGANAVNGIINIVTRTAADTQGTLTQVSVSGRGDRQITTRHGGALSPRANYRIYARHSTWAASVDGDDRWHVVRGGTRVDWQLSPRDDLTLQGDLYDGTVGQTFQLPVSLQPPFMETRATHSPIQGANVLARWQRRSGDSNISLQAYYDHSERRDWPLKGKVDILDVDFQQHLAAARHHFVWGWSYRRSADTVDGSFTLSFAPTQRATHLFSLFAQEQFDLVPKQLQLTVGNKLERNTYTGWEWQPGARLVWHPRAAAGQLLWLALTRAVRTPSRYDANALVTTQILPPNALFAAAPTARLALVGRDAVQSENLLALELGYRTQPSDLFHIDLATFYNLYSDLRSNDPGLPEFIEGPTPYLYVPFLAANRTKGRTYGAELSADWQVRDTWLVRAAYSQLYIDLKLNSNDQDPLALSQERESPRQQFVLRSQSELRQGVQFDITWRYIGALPSQSIDAYSTFDLSLISALSPNLQLQLGGRDLWSSPRREFAPLVVATQPTRFETEVWTTLNWRFDAVDSFR
jgi:iron complex outermembrane receptor protein